MQEFKRYVDMESKAGDEIYDDSQADKRGRLANPIRVERNYRPDRKAMLAALRVVLGLPKPLPGSGRRDSDGQ